MGKFFYQMNFSSLQLSVVIIVSLVFISLLLVSWVEKPDANHPSSALSMVTTPMPVLQRLSEYCNHHTLKNVPILTHSEHVTNFPNPEWVLVSVIATIRHGDRSAIHQLPNGNIPLQDKFPLLQKVGSNGPKNAKLLNEQALEFLSLLPSFDVNVINSEADSKLYQEDINNLINALNTSTIFQTPDLLLSQGQLTSKGFMQHIDLGKYLRSVYPDFLKKINSPDQIYIRSTNYARTIQSVSALLIGIVPQLLATKRSMSKAKIPILTYLHEHAEIMHGIGLRSSSHTVKNASSQEEDFEGGCDKAVKLARKQRMSFVLKQDIKHDLLERFGPSANNKFITDWVDSSMPSQCHFIPFPCSVSHHQHDTNVSITDSSHPIDASLSSDSTNNNESENAVLIGDKSSAVGETNENKPGNRQRILSSTHNVANSSIQCIKRRDLNEMMNEADRWYCDRYTGLEGGMEATRLSMYPFMCEIIIDLYTSAGLTIPSSLSDCSSLKSSKVSMAPKKLYLYSGHDTVIAPVLAVLGVYKGKLCRWPPYASRVIFELYKSSSKAIISKERDYHYLRVIFNGEDITQRIPACSEESKSKNGMKEDGLCSLFALTQQVLGLIKPHNSLAAACSLNNSE
eukprot:gene5846-8067_t